MTGAVSTVFGTPRTVATTTDESEVIVAATDSPLDKALLTRLHAIASADADHGECFEPLGSVILEIVLWLAAAASLWIAVVVYALWS
ncbi:MAG: hypothetical protein JWO52_7773 [Gammaproteobacteria bacterium]|jgi:hypothetical protein|nr:hypothetical protein [Gammaproteobacteria bacterium]